MALVARAKSGEGEDFSLLVQRHGQAVLNLINKMIRDRTVVEDLWQETFVRALENLGTYEPRPSVDGTGPSFASWLYRIAPNLTLDELRRRGRWRMVSWNVFKPQRTNEPEGNDTYEPPADTPDAQTILESHENIQRGWRVVRWRRAQRLFFSIFRPSKLPRKSRLKKWLQYRTVDAGTRSQ